MILTRRFLVLVALMFWQGGFTFYAAVVVPVGQKVLGSHRKQALITREVTEYLNLSGVVALMPLAWDLRRSGDSSKRRRRWRWLAWIVMASTLGLLFWLHRDLDEMFDPAAMTLSDGARFHAGHRIYLWVHTIQWLAAILYALLAFFAWREEDRQLPPGAEENELGR